MPGRVTMTGPMFDGSAEQDMQDASDEWTKNIATIGASMVRSFLNTVLKVQTPYYRLQVDARPEPPGWKISDAGVIYGHWLEGDGSRNAPKTRFKGYSAFRKNVQLINARAVAIGQPIIARYVARMNGE